MFTYKFKINPKTRVNPYTPFSSASRVDSAVADGGYTLNPESEEGAQEGQVNTVVADQDPPKPESNFEQEGKPQSIT